MLICPIFICGIIDMQKVSIVELRHLRYFIAVAEEMNFRRAAEKLNMTQPPLSQQIQQLEAELGFALFHRKGRSISLTDAGAVFLKHVRQLLAELESAIQQSRRVDRGALGSLSIGFVETALYRGLPDVIKRFQSQFPEVELSLKRLTSAEHLNALSTGKIDVGFCRIDPEQLQAPYVSRLFSQEALCAVLPASHALAQQDTLQLADLADERFILFPQHLGAALYKNIVDACRGAGFVPHLVQEATQFTTIVGLVAVGIGVSVLPISVKSLSFPDIHYQVLPEVEQVSMFMVWYEENQSAVLGNFLSEAD